MRCVLLAAGFLLGALSAGAEERFDVVIQGGEVVDPETGLNAIRNVGVRGDRIASVSIGPLSGARVLDARGLALGPGFGALHQHQQDAPTYRLKALDGVTTALELEMGVPNIN